MRLRYTRTALRQIDDVLTYLAADSPNAAVGLRERILAASALIREHPRAAQATDRPGLRRVVLTPYSYLLFYRVAGDDVIITRLRHAKRFLSEVRT